MLFTALNLICRTELIQTLLFCRTYQLGSAHEWSSVWNVPNGVPLNSTDVEKIFGPRATAVILKILRPSFQISWTWSDVLRIIRNFIQQLSTMFIGRDGKDGELSDQALAGRIQHHMMSFSTNQNVQLLHSPLEIIPKRNKGYLEYRICA